MQTHKQLRPPSLAALARQHGVRPGTLRDWRDKEGIDISNPKALTDRVERKQARVGKDPSPPAENSARESYSEARRRREVATANRAETLAARERGELIEAASIEGEGFRLGVAYRAALDKLANDLPPMLAGLSAGEMSKIIRREHRRTLENLCHLSDLIPLEP
jgi:hypothetical protein